MAPAHSARGTQRIQLRVALLHRKRHQHEKETVRLPFLARTERSEVRFLSTNSATTRRMEFDSILQRTAQPPRETPRWVMRFSSELSSAEFAFAPTKTLGARPTRERGAPIVLSRPTCQLSFAELAGGLDYVSQSLYHARILRMLISHNGTHEEQQPAGDA